MQHKFQKCIAVFVQRWTSLLVYFVIVFVCFRLNRKHMFRMLVSSVGCTLVPPGFLFTQHHQKTMSNLVSSYTLFPPPQSPFEPLSNWCWCFVKAERSFLLRYVLTCWNREERKTENAATQSVTFRRRVQTNAKQKNPVEGQDGLLWHQTRGPLEKQIKVETRDVETYKRRINNVQQLE